eukprot:m.94721 g.94721  ORF g.94721 m.94721 type:complete len:362 (-) comp16562_c0_seq4:76-1161(-)
MGLCHDSCSADCIGSFHSCENSKRSLLTASRKLLSHTMLPVHAAGGGTVMAGFAWFNPDPADPRAYYQQLQYRRLEMLNMECEIRKLHQQEWISLIIEMDAVMRVCHSHFGSVTTRPRTRSFRGTSFIELSDSAKRAKASSSLQLVASMRRDSNPRRALGFFRLPLSADASKEQRGQALQQPAVLRQFMKHPSWPDPLTFLWDHAPGVCITSETASFLHKPRVVTPLRSMAPIREPSHFADPSTSASDGIAQLAIGLPTCNSQRVRNSSSDRLLVDSGSTTKTHRSRRTLADGSDASDVIPRMHQAQGRHSKAALRGAGQRKSCLPAATSSADAYRYPRAADAQRRGSWGVDVGEALSVDL